MYLGLTRTSPPPIHAEIRMLNGLPALVAELPDRGPHVPRRLTIQCALDPDGRIAAVYSVVAARKLRALQPFA